MGAYYSQVNEKQTRSRLILRTFTLRRRDVKRVSLHGPGYELSTDLLNLLQLSRQLELQDHFIHIRVGNSATLAIF